MTSYTDKWACYQAARAVERPGGGWTNNTIRQISGAYGVGPSTLRRWLKAGFPERLASKAFVPTHEDYVAVATHLDIKAALKERKDVVRVSYPTYHRALTTKGDAALVRGALGGFEQVKNNRLYLQGRPLHRNHTWAFDHFQVDVPVLIPRYKYPVKPWATVVSERFSRALAALILILGRPNAETVAAALTEAAVGAEYDGTWIGGLPIQVIYDNARENEAEPIANGLARLGVLGVNTDTYASWQNPAESVIALIQREALPGIPGVTMGGTARDGSPRFTPPTLEGLWTLERLASHLDDFRYRWNTERTQGVLQGRTPVQVWNSDDTEIRYISEAQLVANLTKLSKPHLVLPKGIFFRDDYYLPLPQHGDRRDWRGLKVHVRYLERNRDFIAASPDPGFDDFRIAINQRAMTPEHRSVLLRANAAAEQEWRQIDADATARRQHAEAAAHEVMTAANAHDPDNDGGEPEWDEPDSRNEVDDGPGGGLTLLGTPENYEPDVPAAAPGSVTVIDTHKTSRRAMQARKTPIPAAPSRQDTAAVRATREKRARQAAEATARRGFLPPSRPRRSTDSAKENP